MSWSAGFLAQLGASTVYPQFRVVSIQGPLTSYPSSPTFAELPDGALPVADIVLGEEAPSIEGERLQLPEATCSHGSWTFEITGTNVSRVIQSTRKGRLLRLEMSLDRGSVWESVAIGMVDTRIVSRDRVGVGLTIGCTGMGALLGQRYVGPSSRRNLFSERFNGGALSADYTVGDATLNVDDTSEWSSFDGASVYYIRVWPSDGGTSFVLRATGRTGTTFTGVGATAVWATTAADSESGSILGVSRGTQLNGAYTAGDTTVTVDSTAPWAQLDADAVFYFRIYPTAGDPFVLRATGRTGTTFTSTATAGRLGTTAVNAANNDEVQLVQVVQGHPVECALKVLQSTGTGTNGPWDVLPADWGLALGRDLVDDTYSRFQRDASLPLSGSTLWEIEVPDDETVSDAGAWIQDWLSPFGGIVTLRQGLIIVRVLQDPTQAISGVVGSIGENDILDEMDSFDVQLEDPDSVEYRRATWYAGDVSTTSVEEVTTAPSEDEIAITLDYVFTNRAAVLDEVNSRMRFYYLRIPCVVTVPLAGLTGAQWSPGDLVYFTLPDLQIIPDSTGRTTVDARLAVVSGVDADLPGAAVVVDLLIYPEAGDI